MNNNMVLLRKNCCFFILCTYCFFLLSCTKNFEKYNTNPGQATDEMLTYDNLYAGGFFTRMQQSILPFGGIGSTSTNAYQVVQNLCGDIYGGYHGMTHNWNAAGDGTSYNFSLGWNNAAFNLLYTGVIVNWDAVKRFSEEDHPDLYAVAQIIKAHAVQRTVDMYGPIPYSKAGESTGAPYDDDDAIYYSVLEELDAAIATLKPYAVIGATPLRSFDVIYGGNYTQWIKFANSLKLRMAMRMVYADPVKAREYAEVAVNDDYGVIMMKTDNATVRGTNNRTYDNPLGGTYQ